MSPASHPPFDSYHLPEGVAPPSEADPDRIGHYRVVGRIGAGGMGAVYAGLDAEGGCAAVKIVHPQFATDPDFRARFAREVGLVRRVRATCTAAFLNADVQAGTPWLATEYVPGLTLRQYVKTHGPLTGGMLTAFATGMAEALEAVHAAGVVHRDLKPGNVILSPQGPKVLDFGIARAAEGTVITTTGGLVGTPGWIAPELFAGEEATDCSDMFAWGGMVAFAATGRNPFGTGDVEALVHRTRTQEPDLDGVPEEVLSLVRTAMDKDPERRVGAATAVSELTRGWDATRVQPAEPESPKQLVPEMLATEWRGVSVPAPRRVRRRRYVLPVLTVAAAMLAAVLVGTWLVVRPGPSAEEGSSADATGDSTEEAQEVEEEAEEAQEPEVSEEDGQAMAARARELALDATSYEVFSHDANEVPSSYLDIYRYTEAPEPLYLEQTEGSAVSETILEIGEGPDDVLRRAAAYDSEQLAYVGDFHRVPEGEHELADRERIVENLDLVADPDSEVDYLGESQAPAVDLVPEDMGDPSQLQGRSGHHYSGTFPGGQAREALDDTFDLWIRDDGYPLQFEFTEADTPVTLVYVDFDHTVQIEVPDESELVDAPPPTDAPPPAD